MRPLKTVVENYFRELRKASETFSKSHSLRSSELVFALVLAGFAADTRQNPGKNEGGDIDFAVFLFRPG